MYAIKSGTWPRNEKLWKISVNYSTQNYGDKGFNKELFIPVTKDPLHFILISEVGTVVSQPEIGKTEGKDEIVGDDSWSDGHTFLTSLTKKYSEITTMKGLFAHRKQSTTVLCYENKEY
ncbi:hypothetical protein AB6A40_003537 [Gnathostoma spinigerum]|uniref:Uncharacterized protein n=1 Tax=Gnathostoma spinigerum TaxID=75299 RepID=A0ABD6EIN9_9BILA